MSILINIDMPKSCGFCHMRYESDLGDACFLDTPYIEIATEYQKRQDNCPLVFVPPHGRLIDADALIDAIQEEIDMWKDAGCDMHSYESVIDNYILDAPTIIPASEEGEK